MTERFLKLPLFYLHQGASRKSKAGKIQNARPKNAQRNSIYIILIFEFDNIYGEKGIVLLQNNLHCWFAKEFKDFFA